MTIEEVKEIIEKLSKENSQYQNEISRLNNEIKSHAKLGKGFEKIGFGLVSVLENGKEHLELNEKNSELSTSVIFDFFNSHHMADINSLHDNGFDFISTKQLEEILEKAVMNGNIEKYPYKTLLYTKSKSKHNLYQVFF